MLDCGFVYVSVWPYYFFCVISLLVFISIFLVTFGSFLLCFEGLGIDWGKRKVSGARGDLNGAQ